MGSILVTGTLAIDYLAKYPGSYGRLSDHVGVNVSTRVSELEKHFGGCAMNIAYSLRLLNHQVIPYVMVGRTLDADYQHHIDMLNIDQRGIVKLEDWPHSSHGFIFTDIDGNQFTSFYAGPATIGDYRARFDAFLNKHAADIEFAVIAPDGPRNMIDAARLLNERAIPFLCDPGQGLPDFAVEDCRELVEESKALLVNEHEREYLERNVPNLTERLDTLITTCGEDGARWTTGEGEECERAAKTHATVDPTGCGDAFRAGFVHAQRFGASLRDCIRSGALVASINIEHVGCQSHTLDQYVQRYVEEWNERPEWLDRSRTER